MAFPKARSPGCARRPTRRRRPFSNGPSKANGLSVDRCRLPDDPARRSHCLCCSHHRRRRQYRRLTRIARWGNRHVRGRGDDRDFRADRPNRKWLADFTSIWTAEGRLYVAVILDLFSRRAVSWSMRAERDAAEIMDALVMAVWRRGKADTLLHDSDQGAQYPSEQFQRLLADNGITCSLSRAGNVWDNAAIGSFFSSLKTERTARKVAAPATKPAPTSSMTSNAFTTRADATQKRAISTNWSSRRGKC